MIEHHDFSWEALLLRSTLFVVLLSILLLGIAHQLAI
jgi:hypothetical protein